MYSGSSGWLIVIPCRQQMAVLCNRQLSFLSIMALINLLSYHNYVNVGRVSFGGGGGETFAFP